MKRANRVDLPTPPCPEIERMLWVGASGLRILWTKKSTSPVRPTKRGEPLADKGPAACDWVFLTKGIRVYLARYPDRKYGDERFLKPIVLTVTPQVGIFRHEDMSQETNVYEIAQRFLIHSRARAACYLFLGV